MQKSIEGESVEIRKLVEQMLKLRDSRSELQAEIKKIKDEEDEIHLELKEILNNTDEGMIRLDRKVNKVEFIVKGVRTGGDSYTAAWSKDIVRFANDEKHAKRIHWAWKCQ